MNDEDPRADTQYLCPADRTPLASTGQGLHCPQCGVVYPLVRSIPVLVDDMESVFSRADYTGRDSYAGASYGEVSDRATGLRRFYRHWATKILSTGYIPRDLRAENFAAKFRAAHPKGRFLVVGAGEVDFGPENFIYTDVAFGSHITCICDAHALPYPDAHFDGVMAISVLEHVADPWRCAEELRRVLRPGGLVFAATPFLQPVHMGAHDFTRFTYLGHRRLFRWFDDIQSGPVLGPSTAASFVMQHVLLSLFDAPKIRRVMRLMGRVLALPVKQLDRLTGHGPGAYDAAAAFYFYGSKRDAPLSDKEIIGLYRGLP